MLPGDAIFQFMDTVGDGSGTTNAIGDYTTPDDFIFEAQGDAYLHRLLISIEDDSGMTAEEYGNIAALTNGWELKAYDQGGTEILDLTAGIVVQSNAHIGRVCFDVDIKSWGTTPTNEVLVARWSFDKAGQPLQLAKGEQLRVELADNFAGIIGHYFMVQGYYV